MFADSTPDAGHLGLVIVGSEEAQSPTLPWVPKGGTRPRGEDVARTVFLFLVTSPFPELLLWGAGPQGVACSGCCGCGGSRPDLSLDEYPWIMNV